MTQIVLQTLRNLCVFAINSTQVAFTFAHLINMTSINQILSDAVKAAAKELFNETVADSHIQLQKTRKEFEGDITLVVFPFVKISKKSPEQTAEVIGNILLENVHEVQKFNVVKGFLNLVISEKYWLTFFSEILNEENFGLDFSSVRPAISRTT